jgi:hypothetical protein
MVPMRFPYGDALYVDDEGLLTPKGRSMFKIAGYHQPLVGNGLLCGHDDEGEAKDVYMSVDAVRARVVFFT